MDELESMSLAEFFAAADSVGDRYLTPEEIERRNAELARVTVEAEAIEVE